MPQLRPSKQIDSGVQLSLTLASGCDGAAVMVLPSTVELTLDSVMLSVGDEVDDGTSGITLILGEPYSRFVLMTAAVAVEARSVGKRNFMLLLGLRLPADRVENRSKRIVYFAFWALID